MTQTVLGIDISKKTFHGALMLENGKTKPKVFSNDDKGFDQLLTWLERHQVPLVHACMEATSIYGKALAEFLYEAGHIVSIVNPVRIKGFAKGELLRVPKPGSAKIGLSCGILHLHIKGDRQFRHQTNESDRVAQLR